MTVWPFLGNPRLSSTGLATMRTGAEVLWTCFKARGLSQRNLSVWFLTIFWIFFISAFKRGPLWSWPGARTNRVWCPWVTLKDEGCTGAAEGKHMPRPAGWQTLLSGFTSTWGGAQKAPGCWGKDRAVCRPRMGRHIPTTPRGTAAQGDLLILNSSRESWILTLLHPSCFFVLFCFHGVCLSDGSLFCMDTNATFYILTKGSGTPRMEDSTDFSFLVKIQFVSLQGQRTPVYQRGAADKSLQVHFSEGLSTSHLTAH